MAIVGNKHLEGSFSVDGLVRITHGQYSSAIVIQENGGNYQEGIYVRKTLRNESYIVRGDLSQLS